MENVKEKILEVVNKLPEDTTWDDALYTLYFYSEISKSEDDFKNGRYITLEELREHIDRLEEEYENSNIRQSKR